jgi:hypothetical protein
MASQYVTQPNSRVNEKVINMRFSTVRYQLLNTLRFLPRIMLFKYTHTYIPSLSFDKCKYETRLCIPGCNNKDAFERANQSIKSVEVIT